MDNHYMGSSRHTQPGANRNAEAFDVPVFSSDDVAANDRFNRTEIEQLNTSAGCYERVHQIRRNLRRSDIWIAIGVYLALASLAFIAL